MTENPHCGKAPKSPPINGPTLPDFFIVSLVLFVVLCSIYSIIKYAINKNGSNFTASNKVSNNISIILSIICPPHYHILPLFSQKVKLR